MFCNFSFMICLFSSCLSLAFCNHNHQKAKEEILRTNVHTSSKIIAYAPEAIVGYEANKLYLDESQFHPLGKIVCLKLSSGELLPIPFLVSDEEGSYLVCPATREDGKAEYACFDCKHRWEGNFFNSHCPKCGSVDVYVAHPERKRW